MIDERRWGCASGSTQCPRPRLNAQDGAQRSAADVIVEK
jgi:hypothetical protein